MTNNDLVDALVKTMQEQGEDPHYIIGYLSSFLCQVINHSSKKYQSQVHSDLVWHLSKRSQDNA